jgi:hypothetical protein
MSVWNDNAAAFATTRDMAIAAVRNEAIHLATRFRRAGHVHIAHDVMLAAVERQARHAGIRDVHLPRSTS